jgi:AraC family transcriptional regulator of adaptative response/methylated-DNA-[protein]-cysteine methyltransferase
MLLPRPPDDELYAALLQRDDAYEGQYWVGVTSTGIFCRLTCPARKPRREHTRFFASPGSAVEAGFRPCRRCQPLRAAGPAEPLVAELIDRLLAEPERRWSERDLTALGHDPSTVRRAFRRQFGTTFLELARSLRLTGGGAALAGGAPVIDAQMNAGFESASGFRDAFARKLGVAPGTLPGDALVRATWFPTPLGPMLAAATREGVLLLEFFERPALPAELGRLRAFARGSLGIGRFPPLDALERELDAYFAGTACTFRTPLERRGTPFSRTVWAELERIPPGQTRSYRQIAEAVDRPSATRAVARANGANELALVIPCHRVIGADGSLTGYGGGTWRKQWLIDHERRHFAPAAAAGDPRGSTASHPGRTGPKGP